MRPGLRIIVSTRSPRIMRSRQFAVFWVMYIPITLRSDDRNGIRDWCVIPLCHRTLSRLQTSRNALTRLSTASSRIPKIYKFCYLIILDTILHTFRVLTQSTRKEHGVCDNASTAVHPPRRISLVGHDTLCRPLGLHVYDWTSRLKASDLSVGWLIRSLEWDLMLLISQRFVRVVKSASRWLGKIWGISRLRNARRSVIP